MDKRHSHLNSVSPSIYICMTTKYATNAHNRNKEKCQSVTFTHSIFHAAHKQHYYSKKEWKIWKKNYNKF